VPGARVGATPGEDVVGAVEGRGPLDPANPAVPLRIVASMWIRLVAPAIVARSLNVSVPLPPSLAWPRKTSWTITALSPVITL
jgi:hypothetical protein